MHIVIYIVAGVFLVLTLGLLFTFYHSHHPGTLLMALAYGASAGAAIAFVEWWPLLAGFSIAWGLRLTGLDPGKDVRMKR